MSHTLFLSDEAEDDLVASANYYNEQSVGLGTRFLEEAYTILDKVAEHPVYYKYLQGKKNKRYRCVRLNSFPFLIIFRIEKDIVVIVSVLNTNRRNKYIR